MRRSTLARVMHAADVGGSAYDEQCPRRGRHVLRRAQAARLALIDGAAGLVWPTRGKPRMVSRLMISGGKITVIDMTAGPARLRQLDLKIIGD
jgi:hypothetical protein